VFHQIVSDVFRGSFQSISDDAGSSSILDDGSGIISVSGSRFQGASSGFISAGVSSATGSVLTSSTVCSTFVSLSGATSGVTSAVVSSTTGSVTTSSTAGAVSTVFSTIGSFSGIISGATSGVTSAGVSSTTGSVTTSSTAGAVSTGASAFCCGVDSAISAVATTSPSFPLLSERFSVVSVLFMGSRVTSLFFWSSVLSRSSSFGASGKLRSRLRSRSEVWVEGFRFQVEGCISVFEVPPCGITSLCSFTSARLICKSFTCVASCGVGVVPVTGVVVSAIAIVLKNKVFDLSPLYPKLFFLSKKSFLTRILT
jgi:hypothetical protein